MRMDLFSILCASNSEDERVEKSNNWIFLQIPSNSGACECNVSIVVFCSRIKRARCYHVLWKWTPYRVTYSSWGQVLTDARSNKTDFFKTILLNEVSKGICFFLMSSDLWTTTTLYMCHLPQNRGHIGNRNRRKLVLWFFHPVCPYTSILFYLPWQQETNTWQKNASRGFSLKRNSSQKLLICHIASGTKVTCCIAKYKQ